MSRFIQADYPTTHAGVNRVERGLVSLRDMIRSFDGARGAATLMLAALVSALLVVANELVETWTEGHLLTAWVALWAIAFAALALFAAPARSLARQARAGLKAWAVRRKQAAQDEAIWNAALLDARVMADLSRAMSQSAERDLRAFY